MSNTDTESEFDVRAACPDCRVEESNVQAVMEDIMLGDRVADEWLCVDHLAAFEVNTREYAKQQDWARDTGEIEAAVAEQYDAYDGADEVTSDAFDLVDRDNRNHRKKQRIIRERMHADPGERILEVGCGDGTHAEAYAEAFDYFGVDLSPTLVERTQARIDEGYVLQMDATDLRFRDDSFRSVVGTAILHHLPDARAALSEWLRVTEPGGSVTLMEPNYCFPKDFLSAHLVAEEQHKTQMAPWRVRETLADLDAPGTVRPRLYTPPWPDALAPVYDALDDGFRSCPGLRWASQMLMIHVVAP